MPKLIESQNKAGRKDYKMSVNTHHYYFTKGYDPDFHDSLEKTFSHGVKDTKRRAHLSFSSKKKAQSAYDAFKKSQKDLQQFFLNKIPAPRKFF